MSYLHEVRKQLLMYKPKNLVDDANVELFNEFLDTESDIFNRKNYEPGHITSGGFIVNKERTHCVLMHHKKLNRWIQMGGHIENGMSPLASAEKEVAEESGLESAKPTGKIHHLGVYIFPEHGDQLEHMHYDLCYLFEADVNEKPKGNDESSGVRWFTLAEAYQMGDDGVKEMISKL